MKLKFNVRAAPAMFRSTLFAPAPPVFRATTVLSMLVMPGAAAAAVRVIPPDEFALAAAEAGPAQAPLVAFLRETFATRTRDEWVQWFAHRDVAFAPVLDFREALDEPHIAARGLLVQANGAHHIAPAIRFGGEPPWQPGGVPELEQQHRKS